MQFVCPARFLSQNVSTSKYFQPNVWERIEFSASKTGPKLLQVFFLQTKPFKHPQNWMLLVLSIWYCWILLSLCDSPKKCCWKTKHIYPRFFATGTLLSRSNDFLWFHSFQVAEDIVLGLDRCLGSPHIYKPFSFMAIGKGVQSHESLESWEAWDELLEAIALMPWPTVSWPVSWLLILSTCVETKDQKWMCINLDI